MKTIVITAGHSNIDPGAVGNGLQEASTVTDFRNMVAFYLKQAGASIKTDGDGPTNLPLNNAAALIGAGDIAVEFHLNASDNAAATGVETLSSDADRALGNLLCQAVATTLSIANRGAKGEASGQHRRLLFVQKSGIILELFFVSNAQDVAKYQAKKWLVAKEVARVLLTAAGVSYKL